MGKYSAKANKGKRYSVWRSSAVAVSKMTRQRKRKLVRDATWEKMSGPNALRNDNGIIPRRVRRDMARMKAKRG
jgi:hypothetical protein